MATALVHVLLLMGGLLPCWGEFLMYKDGYMKFSFPAQMLLFPLKCHRGVFALPPSTHHPRDPNKEGSVCTHHSQCFSDCCLMNFDSSIASCAPKSRKAMTCMPQTKGSINIICPCRRGLNCISRDPNCPRRCYWI